MTDETPTPTPSPATPSPIPPPPAPTPQSQVDGYTRDARTLMTFLIVVAPVAVVIGWMVALYASLQQSVDGLPFAQYFQRLIIACCIGIGIPALVTVHSIVVRALGRAHPFPFRGFVGGGISLALGLTLLAGLAPAINIQVALGQRPNASETAVTSGTLVARARALDEASAAKAGQKIIEHGAPDRIPCQLSNAHQGYSYEVRDWLKPPPTKAVSAPIVAYWRSLGYHVSLTELDYYAPPRNGLSLDLQLLPKAFIFRTLTSCVAK